MNYHLLFISAIQCNGPGLFLAVVYSVLHENMSLCDQGATMDFKTFESYVTANPSAMSMVEWVFAPHMTSPSDQIVPSFHDILCELTHCSLSVLDS